MSKESIFIILEKKFTTDKNKNILIKDIGTVYCKDEKIKKKIENLKIIKTKNEEDWDYIDKTEVINKILDYGPKLDVNVFGADDTLIEIKSQASYNKVFHYTKVIFVCLVLFFGAGIAIINFYEDVNMIASLNKIYQSLTGMKEHKPLVFIISYTVGLAAGVIMFFNRVLSSSKRRSKEPGPMELEMYIYDTDLEDYILQDVKNKKK